MRIMAVDDEKLALEALVSAVKKASPESDIVSFRSPQQVLDYVENETVDVAFVDIEMRVMNGIELAKRLKQKNPSINLIFATGYGEFREQAFDLHASGYITKPITSEKVLNELQNLRYSPSDGIKKYEMPEDNGKKLLYCQTFGNFEVYIKGKPVNFKYEKTKELLAYLVDRSSVCTSAEIISALWEDDNHESYLRNLKRDLMSTFESEGCSDVIVNQWGKLGIIPDKISSDLYEWKKGNPAAINAFRGEYMAQYSWAEFSIGFFN